MGSQDSWMVMGDFTADARELAVNYAVTARDAFGAAAGRWEEPAHGRHGVREREFAGLTYTRLVQRWNLPHAQANLWFVGQLGSVRAFEADPADDRRSMWSAAGLADYETTRVYVGGGFEAMRGAGGTVRHDTAYARAGFSFYTAEYDEVQPWFIVETKRERFRDMSKQTTTPMLRLIHRRYFIELGGNRDGAMFNFMLNL